MRNSMDYIYTSGEQKILIEVEQKSARQSVVEQYVCCRKTQGITQEELAKRAGVPRSNITRFESGNYNPSLEMMVRIAAALGRTLQVELVAKEK
ncbi:MAG: helix-turn-helix transcriptional regulator [Bacillota bacterium]|nr:helix-turn-helix transcriptional regulator [Bacillota bacterium]